MSDVLHATRPLGQAAGDPPTTHVCANGVALTERLIDRAVHIRFAEDDARVTAIVTQRTGLRLFAENRAARSDAWLGLRLGPGDWLLLSTQPGCDVTLDGLLSDEAGWSAVDASDTWFCVRMQGPRSRDLIAEACALDLRETGFAIDATGVTRFARIRGLVHRCDAHDAFDVYVERSCARYLWTWLSTSMGHLS